MPNLVKAENAFIPELVPQGFRSWTAYNHHKERVEKVKYWAQGFLGAFVLILAYAVNGYIDMML